MKDNSSMPLKWPEIHWMLITNWPMLYMHSMRNIIASPCNVLLQDKFQDASVTLLCSVKKEKKSTVICSLPILVNNRLAHTTHIRTSPPPTHPHPYPANVQERQTERIIKHPKNRVQLLCTWHLNAHDISMLSTHQKKKAWKKGECSVCRQ